MHRQAHWRTDVGVRTVAMLGVFLGFSVFLMAMLVAILASVAKQLVEGIGRREDFRS